MNKSPDANSFNFFSHFTKLLLCSLTLVIVMLAAYTPVFATESEDNYLKELEQEAESSAKAPKVKKPKNKSDSFTQHFESILMNERPTTFRFYNKLTSRSKNTVVKMYKKESKISTASKLVFDLYFKERR